MLVSSRANKKSFNSINKLLSGLQQNTGLVISRNESKLIFSKGCRNKNELLNIVGMSQGNFPLKYLGMPLSSTYLKPRDDSALIDKCRMATEGWMTKQLSFSGRTKLIKTVILNTISQWSQSFSFPISVTKEIERISANFLWNGKVHAWSWESICRLKSEGGLGVRRIAYVCSAAGIKLVWRMCTNNTMLAHLMNICIFMELL